MRILFNIYPEQSRQRLAQTHLLILAFLNFDHSVHIVFHEGSEQLIQDDLNIKKEWQALPLYGAHEFLFFDGPDKNISEDKYRHLIQQADFIS